jgi:ABC-type transporter Mla subunit MlaD
VPAVEQNRESENLEYNRRKAKQMNIDERLQALTMNLELQSHDIALHSEQISQLARIASATHETIARLANSVDALTHNVDALLHIAEIHERRITNLDGAQA